MKKVPSHEGTFCVFTRFSAMSEAKKEICRKSETLFS